MSRTPSGTYAGTPREVVRANPPTHHAGRRVVVLGGLVALGPLSTDAYVPGLPRISSDLHASASSVQLTVTTVLLGLALGQLLVGPLSDAAGRRRPLLVGLAVYLLTSFAAAAAPEVGALIGLRALQGIGGASVLVVAYAMLRDLFDGPALARRFASLLLVSGVAPVLGPLAGAGLIGLAGWRSVFVALGVLAGLLFAATILVLPETLPTGRRRPAGWQSTARTYRRLVSDNELLGYVTLGSLIFAAMFAYIAASPFVLEDHFGLSVQNYSVVFAINAVGLVIAAQASGRVVGRISPQRLVGWGVAVTVVGAAGLVVSALAELGVWAVLLSLFLVVTSVGLVMPNAAALALGGHGADAGSAAALLGAGQFLLGGLMAPVMSAFGSVSLTTMAVAIAALVVLAAIILAALASRTS